jgi:sulfide:quinone oxidoreductase
MLDEKGIELVTEFNTGEVDGEAAARLYDEREVDFDLAVVIPLHGGAEYVGAPPGSATSSGSSPPTRTRCSRR